MFIYKYSLHDYDCDVDYYLCHATITPDDYRTLVAEIEQSLIPARIEEEREWKINYYAERLVDIEKGEFGSRKRDKNSMREYIIDERDKEHEIHYGDVGYRTVEILKEKYGFQDYTFDAEVSRGYNQAITTFKLDTGI